MSISRMTSSKEQCVEGLDDAWAFYEVHFVRPFVMGYAKCICNRILYGILYPTSGVVL